MEHPFAITLEVGTSHANHTGTWRVERPIYVDRLPPCNDACPAGENIQRWLYHAESGDYEAAWRQLIEENPLPAIMGRICYHPCETACNRAQLDEAVGINAVERFLGDLAIEKGWAFDSPKRETQQRVLVVGAGPSGLAAAYHLRRLGHHVSLADSAQKPGGMMRYGIPAYRLPRAVLDAEIERIFALGVEWIANHRVDDVLAEREQGRFNAVYLAVGAQLGRRIDVPAGDSARIVDALSLLRSVEEDRPVLLGRRVAVYGGGNTAMDAARTARRLGATETVIVYRRTDKEMPAEREELEQALSEGITTRWLSTVDSIEADHLVIEKVVLEDGHVVPTGEFEQLPADALVLALGQDSDLSVVQGAEHITVRKGVVEVGPSMMTGEAGIFAGGDAVPSERTATVAIGHAKRAARAIDDYLAGRTRPVGERHGLASFERLNTWYYDDAPRSRRPELAAARRVDTFAEVIGGLNAGTALFEARRCLSCGNCFECDNCFGVCPDNAVIKLSDRETEAAGGRRYAFNYDYCKGCGVCVEECPCGAIDLVPEAN
ncbi:MAG: NAD(P)-binding protein [Actinomycetota bacterium]|jgi:NADPH-dependent glutamate synthase beta subunit-like oxidoreductase/Pyruvate/2-oxoacid:ferredoxin oxidoreductase delta subunit|nr:NAD(P)-binding protein [Actinomycetota bacterium]